MNKAAKKLFVFSTLICAMRGMAAEYTGGLPSIDQASYKNQPTYWNLKINVNGHVSDDSYNLKKVGDDFWVDTKILRANYVRINPLLNGEVNASQLKDVHVKYNNQLQTLDITVPLSWLPKQQFSATNDQTVPAYSDTGLSLDYDIYGYKPARETGYVTTGLTATLFNNIGRLVNTGSWYQPFNGQSGKYNRTNTTLIIDNYPHLLSFQAGDVVTRPVSDENSVRMGGIKLSRKYSMAPDLITYPTMSVQGSAAVPTSVDIFVDNARVANNSVNSGPFVISNIPYISGDGTAQVVTTDATGKKVTSTVSFYNSSDLLKKGLDDFDFNAGLLRYNTYDNNDRYQYFASSLSYRRGLTDYLTAAVHGEAASDLNVLGTALNIKVSHFGVVSGSLYQSRSKNETQGNDQTGQRYSLGYSYSNNYININLNHQKNNANYHSLADYKSDYEVASRSDQVSLSANLGKVSIGSGYFVSWSGSQIYSRVANLSFSGLAPFNGNWMLTLSRELERNDNAAYLSWSVSLGKSYNFSAFYNHQTNTSNQGVTLSRSISGETGLGGSLRLQHSRYMPSDNDPSSATRQDRFDGLLDWRHQYGELSAGVWHNEPHQEDYWMESTGSIVFMDNSLFATRQVNDGFLVVDTGGVANVPYSYEGRHIGKTNGRGIGLIPDVMSYHDSLVYINPQDLGADIDVHQTEQISNVKTGGGRIVHFNMRRTQNALLKILDRQGRPIAAGLQVSGLEDGQTTVTGYDGLVYLNNVPHTLNLVITGGDAPCAIQVKPEQIDSASRRIAPLTCVPDVKSSTSTTPESQ